MEVYGKEYLEAGEIPIYHLDEVPEFVRDATKQGILERVGMVYNAEGELGGLYHFNPSKLD